MLTTKKNFLQLVQADELLEENPTRTIEIANTILKAKLNPSALLVRFLGQVKLGQNEIDLESIRTALKTPELDLEHRRTECHLLLGRAYRTQGLLEPAFAQFRFAFDSALRRQHGRQMAEALNLIASTLATFGEQEEAITYLNQALEIDQTQPLGAYKANILINLSSIYRKLGKIKEAIEYVQQAYQILEFSEEQIGLNFCYASY